MDITRTLYMGRHVQHVLEVEFNVAVELPEPSVGYFTTEYTLDDLRVLEFNGIPRTDDRESYFQWLDEAVWPLIENDLDAIIEEETRENAI